MVSPNTLSVSPKGAPPSYVPYILAENPCIHRSLRKIGTFKSCSQSAGFLYQSPIFWIVAISPQGGAWQEFSKPKFLEK